MSSPANWLFQSSTILVALHVLASGIVLYSICRQSTSKQTAESYMDNIDCTYCDQPKQEEDTETIQQKYSALQGLGKNYSMAQEENSP
eukprot:7977876-Ditylum_brightwellii.AAC.1